MASPVSVYQSKSTCAVHVDGLYFIASMAMLAVDLWALLALHLSSSCCIA